MLAQAGWLRPARVARGRPLRLALRGIAAAIISAVVMRLIATPHSAQDEYSARRNSGRAFQIATRVRPEQNDLYFVDRP